MASLMASPPIPSFRRFFPPFWHHIEEKRLRDSDQPDKKESKQARNPGNFSAGQQYKEKRGVVVVGCSGYKTAQQLLLLYKVFQTVPHSTLTHSLLLLLSSSASRQENTETR
jgi:hypothetical protein